MLVWIVYVYISAVAGLLQATNTRRKFSGKSFVRAYISKRPSHRKCTWGKFVSRCGRECAVCLVCEDQEVVGT